MSAFLNVPFEAGQIIRRRIPIAELADGTPVALPVATITGRQDGPTLYLQAGLHGDELTGIEICREALSAIQPDELRGRLVAVPVANVPSHLTRTRGFLHEERWLIDINRVFPGSGHGLLTERIASILFEQFIRAADFTIDLHSALDGCDIAPFVYVDPDDDEHGTLAARERNALAFGTPYVFYRPRGAAFGTSDLTRSLAAQADLAGAPTIIAEMGESRRVSRQHVPLGVNGVRNVLMAMGMLQGAPSIPSSQRRFTKISLVHAERGGGLRMVVDLGQEVSAGDPLGEIVDVFGQPVEHLVAAVDGFVLRIMRLGSVATGAEVVWIGH